MSAHYQEACAAEMKRWRLTPEQQSLCRVFSYAVRLRTKGYSEADVDAALAKRVDAKHLLENARTGNFSSPARAASIKIETPPTLK